MCCRFKDVTGVIRGLQCCHSGLFERALLKSPREHNCNTVKRSRYKSVGQLRRTLAPTFESSRRHNVWNDSNNPRISTFRWKINRTYGKPVTRHWETRERDSKDSSSITSFHSVVKFIIHMSNCTPSSLNSQPLTRFLSSAEERSQL